MIPRAHVTAWRASAPWPSDAQIEQDLVLSRALVEMFSRPAVAKVVAFRGGGALHKLFLKQPGRYSEDIDLVQVDEGAIGAAIDSIRSRLDPWLGAPRRNESQGRVAMLYLNSPLAYRLILSKVSGNAITRLTLAKLKSAVIPVPPLREQQQISFLLDQELPKVKSLEVRIGNMISDLQIQDQAVLAKAFRGELVPHDPNDEPASVLLGRIREEKARKAADQKTSLKQRGNRLRAKRNNKL
jgi:hypothetical protein